MKSMTYQKVFDLINDATKQIRNILNYIQAPFFRNTWDKLSEEDRLIVFKYIKAFDKRGLVRWMTDHQHADYGELTFKELVAKARSRSLVNYSRKNRQELILGLEKQDEEKEDKRINDLFAACTKGCDLQPQDDRADESDS